TRTLIGVALMVLPALAHAAGPEALSLKSGAPAELLGKTLALARGLFALSLVLGLLVEAFGSSPDKPKSYGGVAWRALVVVALLAGYPRLFGSVVVTAEAIAARIAPQEIWDRFAQQSEQSARQMVEREHQRAAPKEGGQPGTLDVLTSSNVVVNYVGGALFDSLVAMLVMLGQACQRVFGQLSRIILALFYVLGPLALVFHIPGPSRTAGKWFAAFVTIACWPILSAVLLAIATSLMFRTDDAAMHTEMGTAFGAVCSALLMVVMNLAVPLLASAIVGGAVRNIAGTSLAGAAMFTGMGTRLAGSMLRGAPAGAAGAGGGAGAGAGGAPGSPGGGGGGVASAGVVDPNPAPAATSPSTSAAGGPGGRAQAGERPDPIAVALGISSPGAASSGAPAAAYQPAAASVPLMSEPSLSYQPPPARTQPGHPYDEMKDNGWGDIGQLEHVGWARPPVAAPEDPQERITAPPENGLIQIERLQKRARTKS
ncbi:MAG TPA: hypothetical protein VIG99_22590, partial [Myxococcaceae bacterium]